MVSYLFVRWKIEQEIRLMTVPEVRESIPNRWVEWTYHKKCTRRNMAPCDVFSGEAGEVAEHSVRTLKSRGLGIITKP